MNRLKKALRHAAACTGGGCLLWVLAAVLPSPARAQVAQAAFACSQCRDCFSCAPGTVGGNSCDFGGPPSCPCRETGGNCNPEFAPIDDAFQAEWSCRSELKAVYRQLPDGTVRYVAPSEAPNVYRLAYESRHLDSRHLVVDAASGRGYSKDVALGGMF